MALIAIPNCASMPRPSSRCCALSGGRADQLTHNRKRFSNTSRGDVAVHLLGGHADEYYAVAGRIAFVPFHFMVGDGYSGPLQDSRLTSCDVPCTIGDDRNVVIAFHVEAVGLVSVGFAAARLELVIRLHEPLKPTAYMRRLTFPLA